MTKEENKLHTLKEASAYLGLSEPSLRHIFYNLRNKQSPAPTYLGDKKLVKKNLNNVHREFEVQQILRFTTSALEEFKNNSLRNNSDNEAVSN